MSFDGQFKSIQDRISASLVSTTRTTAQIAAEDLAFYRSSNPVAGRELDKQNSRLLSLARRLIQNAAVSTEVAAPELPDAESVDDNWKGVVDVVDNLLEKADACLDEYTGVIKRLSPTHRSTPVPVTIRKTLAAKQRTQDLPKPQLLFEKVPDNQETTAFKPLLRTKPHAEVPLEESISPIFSEDGFREYDTQFYLSWLDCGQPMKELINTHFRYRHPYQTEILQSTYPPSAYVKSDPIPYLPFESTTATFVDTIEGVEAMLADLKSAKELAIDLEHHDTHSYVGLVSLMQISTREKDWVIDTLKPWREELQMLNEVFADPSILKVGLVRCSVSKAKTGRFYMVHTWTSSGYKGTWAYMLWDCSILIMRQYLLVTLAIVWPGYLISLRTSKRRSSIRWLIGVSGLNLSFSHPYCLVTNHNFKASS